LLTFGLKTITMQSEEAHFLQRKVNPGSIDVHPTEKAIVVNYEVEAVILGEDGQAMLGDRKESQKIVRVENLTDSTDIELLSEEVIRKCTLIPPNKLAEVEQLLYYLRKRKETDLGKSAKPRSSQKLADPTPDHLTNAKLGEMEAPSLNNIDDYVELLYEDVPSKIKASILLFCLLKNPDNLEGVLEHGTVMGALRRVLSEDWRKSVELSTNIMYIFFCFSSYIQFHQVIAHYKVGALCMSIVEHEMNRLETWKNELKKKKETIDNEENREQALKEFEKFNKKVQNLARKQDQLLKVAFYLLLNLSEDMRVEVKMKNKGIVKLLCKALETRSSVGLSIVVISFLKKLSIFKENKNEMAKCDIIPKIGNALKFDDDLLTSLTLRLLLNLSFDTSLRLKMVSCGLLPKIVEYLDNPGMEAVTLCLLYHLSVDDKTRSMMAYTECIPKVVKMILDSPAGPINPELAALAINIASRKNNTQLVCDLGNGTALRHLVKRTFKSKDGLLLKMIRNMSQHEGPTKSLFVNFISQFANALKKEKEEDFVIECVGTLANLNFKNINFDLILKKYDLLPYILNVLKSAHAEDDLVLETIVLVGTVALDENCAPTLAQSGIVQVLVSLLNAKQEDDELVLQIVYVFYQMIWHEDTRNVIISHTQAPSYMIDLMHDRNSQIRNVCDNTLDIIREYDSEWERKIQFEKFKWHNSQWMDIINDKKPHNNSEVMNSFDDVQGEDVHPYYHGDHDLYDLYANAAEFDEEMMLENMSSIPPEYLSEQELKEAVANGAIVPAQYPYPVQYEDPMMMANQQNIHNYYQQYGRNPQDFIPYNY